MLLLQQGVRPRERELVDALLTGEEATSRIAAGAALVSEGFVQSGRALVFVVEPTGGNNGAAPTDHEVLLSQIVVRVKRAIRPGSVAATTRAGHGTLVVSLDGGSEAEAEVADMALRVHNCLTTLPKSQPAARTALLTYGTIVEEWSRAARAYRQAVLTMRVARSVSSLGSVVGWPQLGAYQVLSLISPPDLGGSDADRRLEALLSKPDLVLTLETYLEFAGDAKRTAEQLNLHRASLYYRLNRIEEVLAIDLKRGDDRLALHLALKTLRLRGLLS
jgi:sugar diacid utilization regulator